MVRKIIILAIISVCILLTFGRFKLSHYTDNENPELDTYHFLIKHDFTSIQACAIMATIKLESNFDCTTCTTEGNTEYGLFQWSLNRKENLTQFASDINKPIDELETQLLFFLEELNPNSEYYSILNYNGYEWNDFLEASSPSKAAKIFCIIYIKPYFLTDLEMRTQLAEVYYSAYNH